MPAYSFVKICFGIYLLLITVYKISNLLENHLEIVCFFSPPSSKSSSWSISEVALKQYLKYLNNIEKYFEYLNKKLCKQKTKSKKALCKLNWI